MAIGLLVNPGCAGMTGCGAGIFVTPNPVYAGSYTGKYTPQTGSGLALTFDLTLDAPGVLAGTATETASSRTATVEGRLVDYSNCGEQILLEMRFTFASESERQLTSVRSQQQTQPWHFNGTYTQTVPLGTGQIELTKQ